MKKINISVILVYISLLCFFIHQYLQFVIKIRLPFIDNYLDPALMMPILLHAVVWERRLLFKNLNAGLSAVHIFCYFMLTAFIAEVIFPIFSTDFTGDYYDIIYYAAGAVAYYFAQLITFMN